MNKEKKEKTGSISDGYHTFDELYEHRTFLFSVLCKVFSKSAWLAFKHADGSMFTNMFIVGITTPLGQYTYHCEMENLGMFENTERLEFAPKWDGHKPEDYLRLQSLIDKNIIVVLCTESASAQSPWSKTTEEIMEENKDINYLHQMMAGYSTEVYIHPTDQYLYDKMDELWGQEEIKAFYLQYLANAISTKYSPGRNWYVSELCNFISDKDYDEVKFFIDDFLLKLIVVKDDEEENITDDILHIISAYPKELHTYLAKLQYTPAKHKYYLRESTERFTIRDNRGNKNDKIRNNA